jgi:hypothetical protein
MYSEHACAREKLLTLYFVLNRARSHTKRALDIYASLIKDFNRTQWTAVEAQLLRQTLVLREGATDANGQSEKLLSVLALIRNGLSTGSLRWTLQTRQTDGSELASSLLAEARRLSEQLEKGLLLYERVLKSRLTSL